MESTNAFIKSIGELIGKDDLALAIQKLYALLKDSPKLDEAILQSARYNDVLKQIRLGVVDFEQANLTKNQIRYALLDLVHEIEIQENEPNIQSEILRFLKKSEYDLFISDIKKFQHNQFSTTSDPLVGKTVDLLDKKQLNYLFNKPLVKQHFKQYKVKKNDDISSKLKTLQLITNGYVIKGTFLCLTSIDNMRSVTRTAYESRFFTFRDLEGMNTKVVQLVSGSLIQQFEKLIDHIMSNLYIHRDLDTRTDDYEIPEKVFRELLANAFIHASYADDAITGIKVEIYPDRIVFFNAGLIKEDIRLNLDNNDISYIVNPEIVKVFFLHDFVETAGSGIARVQKILKDNRMLPANIEQKAGYVKVTVFKAKKPLVEPLLEKAYQLIDKQDIAEYFTFMETHIGQDNTLLSLQKQFIEGASDALFFNRLKVFAANAFK